VIAGVGLALFAALVGTACTPHAGAAAQVGSQTIETSALRDIVDRGVVAVKSVPEAQGAQGAQTLDRPELQRRALTTLVQKLLLSAEANRRGVSVTEQDVDAYSQAYAILNFGSVATFEKRAAAAGFAAPDIRVIMWSGALEQAIQDKITPDLVASDADVQAQYDHIVAQVGEIPLTLDQARPYLSRFLVGNKRAEKLRPVMVDASTREGVTVNPRFGTWNSKEFAVVAADGSIATTTAPTPTLDTNVLS
jgi:hypothetical protein